MEPESAVERRIVTVLFADLVGFTTLSERLDPEDVATIQDAYFAGVREVVGRHGGRVEKFIGDAAMAVFGLPLARDDDADRAVRAGLALVAAVEHLGARLGMDDAGLQLRVGVNTGEVVSTEPSPGEWRVTGDTVNTAARLQAASQPGRVLVGELTALTVADAVDLEDPQPLDLKGKAAPVRARLVAGIHPDRSRERAMGQLRAGTLGREDELALLQQAAVTLAPPRRTARWLVVAPPGVGKTRLLAELAERLAGSVCFLRTQLRPELDAPFASITQLARDALGSDRDRRPRESAEDRQALTERLRESGASPARADVLADELAALLETEGAASAVEGGQPVERTQRFAAWIEAFDLLACDQRAVWFLEDLHWAGPDLLAFIDQVHATPAPHGRLVIGTSRPALLEREPAWCGPREDAAIHRLDLPPLAERSARQLVQALVGDACLPDRLVERIVERSDGNPLFIEELLRSWLSLGILVDAPGAGCRLVDPDRTVDLPATVQAIYAGQLDDLPTDARTLARRASVAGRVFPVDALPALRAPAGEALVGLRTRRLIDGPLAAELGPSYAYRHALLRDAGYATLARLERARLHARLAAWMVETAGERVDQVAEAIARHYQAAVLQLPALTAAEPGLDREALAVLAAEWLERAASVALRASAQETARDLIMRALDATPDAVSLDRARRLALLGEATSFSGDMDAGVRAYAEAAADYRTLLVGSDAATREVARDGLASVVLAQGTLLIEQLRFREAESLADEALNLIRAGDDLATARLRYLRAWAQVAYQPRAEAALDLRAAIAIAEREGDTTLRLDALYVHQSIQADTGEISPGELRTGEEQIAELALRAGSLRRAIGALRARGLGSSEDEPGEGLPWVQRSIDLAEAHGYLEERAWGAYALAELGFVRGDWEAATEAALEGLAIAEANAYHRPAVRTWMALTPMALARGRVDLLRRAQAWVEPRRATLPDSPFARFSQAAMDLRFAAVGLRPGFVPSEDLLDAWDEGPGLPSWQASTWTNVGAWIEAGRLDLADHALERIRYWLAGPFASPLQTAIAEGLDARLRRARGDLDPALERADRGLRSARELRCPWAIGLLLRLRGNLLAASGQADAASIAHDEAGQVEAALGMVAVPPGPGGGRAPAITP